MRYVYAFLFVFVLSCDVQAAQCWQARGFEEIAAEQWHEVPVNHGVADGGDLVRVYVNQETRSWTMTMIRPDGLECVMSAGQNWQAIKETRDET